MFPVLSVKYKCGSVADIWIKVEHFVSVRVRTVYENYIYAQLEAS